MVAEGVGSAASVLALAERTGVEMPIATEVAAVLAATRTPAQAVSALMGREARAELHGFPPIL